MDALEERILKIIDERKEEIILFGRDIFANAELGYKEFRTAQKFTEVMERLHMAHIKRELAVTGVKAYLKKEKNMDMTIALIGEMDALRIPKHRFVNPQTQAVHACGHHAQLTGVIGAAIAVSDPLVREALDGNIVFFATPSEEYGEIEFKNHLKNQGKIQYGGGKSELIRIGAFEDIHMSFVHHVDEGGILIGSGSSNGFISKIIRYLGRSAHAANSPEKGVNALNAAALGLSALQFQRETFKDEDAVRVHPILTQSGDLVNVIPDEAVIETLVRAKNIGAIYDADRKTERAFKAGAYAIGAGYEIFTMPGYLPKIPQKADELVVRAAQLAAPNQNIVLENPKNHMAASTDVGDLQHVQPVLSFYTGGVKGAWHSEEFAVVNEEEAYLTTAKIFALSAYALLKNGAKEARSRVSAYQAPFNRESYIDFMESFIRTEQKAINSAPFN